MNNNAPINPFARVIYLDSRKTYFMVQTLDGYVGRYNMTEPLRGDMPKGLGYTYDTPEDALAIARGFADAVVREVLPQY